MSTETITTCDVIGCKKEGNKVVECCHGYTISRGNINYKKFEKPSNPQKTDLCKKHYKQWSENTCKLLKMDKEAS